MLAVGERHWCNFCVYHRSLWVHVSFFNMLPYFYSINKLRSLFLNNAYYVLPLRVWHGLSYHFSYPGLEAAMSFRWFEGFASGCLGYVWIVTKSYPTYIFVMTLNLHLVWIEAKFSTCQCFFAHSSWIFLLILVKSLATKTLTKVLASKYFTRQSEDKTKYLVFSFFVAANWFRFLSLCAPLGHSLIHSVTALHACNNLGSGQWCWCFWWCNFPFTHLS